MVTVIRTGKSLAQFLDNVIDESIKSALHQKALQEKEKQLAATGGAQAAPDNSEDEDGGDTDLFGGGDTGGDEGEAQTSKTGDDETEKLAQGNIQPKDIVDKLNTIRSGKSFKDSAVSSAIEEYVGSLSKAEKTALLAFLKGIAQIVTGEIPAQNAIEPDKDPADVSMQKGPGPEKSKHIQPNVIVNARPKEKVKGGAEDTSGPVPITPKRR